MRFIKSHTILSLIILLIGSLDAKAGFEVQQSGLEEDLTAVYFVNERIGFAVGDKGVMVKTINGGKKWREVSTGTIENLKSVWFINADTGFVIGENGTFLRTLNAGIDWQRIKFPIKANFESIKFVNNKTGFAVGHSAEGGVLVKTSDGGLNWQNRLIREDDNSTWQSQDGEINQIYLTQLSFLDEKVGLIGGFVYNYKVGKHPFICKTEDGGMTFFNLSPKINNNDWYIGKEIVSINYLNENDACAIVNTGTGPEFMFISNYRVTAFEQNQFQSNFDSRGRFFSSVFLGRFTGYITGLVNGKSKVIKTIDQGNTFMFLDPPVENTLYASAFPNQNTGYFIGQNGVILKLKDENNFVVLNNQSIDEYADPPFSIAATRPNLRKTQIHIYNLNTAEKPKLDVELFDDQGNLVEVKRHRVRYYKDEIRVRIKTSELKNITYFYAIKNDVSTLVNGKINLGFFAEARF